LKKKKESEEANVEASSALVQECTRLQHEGKMVEAVGLLLNELDVLFAEQNDKEIEALMNILSAFIKKSQSSSNGLTNKWREIIASNPTDRSLLRLKLLANIYQSFDTNSINRYETFLAIAQVAYESGNSELVIPKLHAQKQVEKWLSEWGANLQQKTVFYKLIHKMMKDSNRSVLAHKILVRFLQEYNETSADEPDVVTAAVDACLEAITLEELFQCDHLFGLKAVQNLENHPQHSSLYRLLQIFAKEKLESFTEFQSQHPGVLQSLGLQEESCTRKLRLLSLASLAAETHEIPYSLIISTLQINEDEIENWIIMGVSAKLIEAKMDQLRKVAVVSFCVQRVFTGSQWKQLSTKLDKWKISIQQLLQVVQQSKHSAAHQLQNLSNNGVPHNQHPVA